MLDIITFFEPILDDMEDFHIQNRHLIKPIVY